MQTKTATAPLKAKRLINKVPSPRQRRVAKLMVDALETGITYNTHGELIKTAGYGTGLQTQPQRVLESVGVINALSDLGFTEENAKNVVKSILENDKAKHSDRLKAADMVFKVHGTYAAEKTISLNIDANVDNIALMALAERMRDSTR